MKRDVLLGDKQLEWFRRLHDELSIDYDALKAENDLLKSNASMPCNSCVALRNDLDMARNEIALLKSNTSFPCGSCESLLAEINELKLTHTTCVDELEHARAKINELKTLSSTMCSVMKSDDALLAPNGNHDALDDILDIDASIIICNSCIEASAQ